MQRTLPKKLSELGRIRIGDQEENSNGRGKHPRKLDCFRLTSANKPLLHFAANLYGGEVRAWEGGPTEGQWELYTTCNALDVLIPTMSAVSISYEMWAGGGCKLRCNGEVITHCPAREVLVGQACQCPADDQARAEQVKDGKACTRILRLNVLLPDLPGIGSWRLETKGYYATAELVGTLEMLQYAGAEHSIVEAVLRLEQRSVRRLVAGKTGDQRTQTTTLKFAVPVLWFKYAPRQLLQRAEHVLLAPVSADRHAANIADLFGDDPRGSTLQAAPPVARPPAPASCGWRDTIEKHLIDTDLLDARVPASLREECLVAFHAASVPDSVGLGLAGALLDALDRAREPENTQKEEK